MSSLIDHAYDKKECTGAEPVIDHLQNAALDALSVEREHAEHDEPKVAHTGECDETLHIDLNHCHPRPIHDAYHREDRNPPCRVRGSVGEEWNREADEPICSHLQEYRRQHHTGGDPRFRMVYRHPR